MQNYIPKIELLKNLIHVCKGKIKINILYPLYVGLLTYFNGDNANSFCDKYLFNRIKKLDIHGTQFSLYDFICLATNDDENDLPLFGLIKQIICINDAFFLVVQKALTYDFNDSYLAYRIKKRNVICLVPFENPCHGQPLFPHEIDGKVFVKLRNSTVTEFVNNDNMDLMIT